ncbi:acyl-CoA dehydrogenase family protein [Nocardioides daejeonensis]|uniref:acyl-CoA dehydrogenase family protein n=1 Tax=Nocardioides daejeonensis TaxID=1046556 RepID=UPI000D74B633|nr:acyl-CoA dehydrogenase family protein [Nocardioides daejeonensis]
MFEWSEEELAVRDAVRQFVDKEIRPLRDDLEHGGMPPYEVCRKYYKTFGLDEAGAELFDWQIRRDEARDAGAEFDEPAPEGSGVAMGPIANIELVKVSMGIPTAIGVSVGMVAGTINALGTIEQRKRWARDIMTLDKIGSWAITEPDAGSDAFGGMRTTAKPDGDGWVINGQKTFITNGPYADTIVVYCKLDDGSEPDRRKQPVLIFVLDAGMEGLTQGKPFKKMGMASSPTGELFFDNVRVGPDRLLAGQPGSDGRESARKNFIGERVGIATFALGIIEECQRLSIDYAKQRELWGQPISGFQLIQLKLAEMEIARVNVQNMVFKGIAAQRSGKMDLAEASAIKLYSSRAACEVAMEAVQLFGGNGYMAEYRVEQLARDAKSLMIYAGSNEVQVTHVAKGLLRR